MRTIISKHHRISAHVGRLSQFKHLQTQASGAEQSSYGTSFKFEFGNSNKQKIH